MHRKIRKTVVPLQIIFPLTFCCLLITELENVWYAKSFQSCPALCNHMDCSLPGPSVHGILQARILEWVSMPFSRKSTSVQYSSVAQSCPTLCDPMKCSTPGLPVHHQLPEFTQTHVHQVGDAFEPSHLLLSPSPPAPNPSQHQSFPMSQLFT